MKKKPVKKKKEINVEALLVNARRTHAFGKLHSGCNLCKLPIHDIILQPGKTHKGCVFK